MDITKKKGKRKRFTENSVHLKIFYKYHWSCGSNKETEAYQKFNKKHCYSSLRRFMRMHLAMKLWCIYWTWVTAPCTRILPHFSIDFHYAKEASTRKIYFALNTRTDSIRTNLICIRVGYVKYFGPFNKFFWWDVFKKLVKLDNTTQKWEKPEKIRETYEPLLTRLDDKAFIKLKQSLDSYMWAYYL